jgi:hypothetical protein
MPLGGLSEEKCPSAAGASCPEAVDLRTEPKRPKLPFPPDPPGLGAMVRSARCRALCYTLHRPHRRRRRSCRGSRRWCWSERWAVRRWPTLSRPTTKPMAAAEGSNPAARPADRYPVPGYVPAEVCPVLRWTRRHVARVTARYQASPDDLWDEALTALIRAAVYFKPQDPAAYRSSEYAQLTLPPQTGPA